MIDDEPTVRRTGPQNFAAVVAILATLPVAGCAQNPFPVAESGVAHSGVAHSGVEQFGAMREVMREGRTEPRLRLADAVAEPHAYAVGAIEGLRGEITIADGKVWVARVDGNDLRVDGPEPIDGDQATLLTIARVPRWQSVTIDVGVEGRALETLIEQTARERGIDTSMPFPFVVEGRLVDLGIHVINGYCPVATDPAAVDAQPWRWSGSRPADAVIVGFFAPDAAGTMTHHGTSVHMHAILSVDGRTITGHVDRLTPEPGMTLYVPDVN